MVPDPGSDGPVWQEQRGLPPLWPVMEIAHFPCTQGHSLSVFSDCLGRMVNVSTQQPPDLRIVQARVTMEHIADDGMPTRSLGVML